jgi:hypothetical protein
VALCSAFDGVAVFTRPTDGELSSQLADVAAAASYPVFRYDVPVGLDAILAAGRSVLASDLDGTVIGFAPNIYTGGIDLEAAPGSDPDGIATRARDVLARAGDSAVQVVVHGGAGGEALVTRQADTAPWWMGGQLVAPGGGYCSSGVRITIAGVDRLLTAGHCTSSSFTNNGNLVGNQFTTTYPGNADVYGDWKLLSGSTYGMRVFNGGAYGTRAWESLARSGEGDQMAPVCARQEPRPGRFAVTTSPTLTSLGPSTTSSPGICWGCGTTAAAVAAPTGMVLSQAIRVARATTRMARAA